MDKRVRPVVKSDTPVFSIVIPVHNESDSVDELVTAIDSALASMSGSYEILFVDDGSTDDTLEKLRGLAHNHRRIRVFSFRRNLGKSHALECGFRMATGDYILTMDA